MPVEALVPALEQTDQERAEDGTRQIADTAEDGRGERDQTELEALVVADAREVQGVDETGGAGERTGDQERERDRLVHVDAHDRGGVLVLRGGAHRLALARVADQVREGEQYRHGDE